ncbi:hypothetical protein J3F83DRAFT_733925 [Trichoderma novae-zelandiae]
MSLVPSFPLLLLLHSPFFLFHLLPFISFFPVRISFGGANCSGRQRRRLKILFVLLRHVIASAFLGGQRRGD